MWPFSISDSQCAKKLHAGLAIRFADAKDFGLTPVDLVSYDYLLGYVTSQVLVGIEYDCKRRKAGPTWRIIAMAYLPFLGQTVTGEIMVRIEQLLGEGNSTSALGQGFITGNKVMRVAYGETTYDHDEEMRQAKQLARQRCSEM